MPRPDEDLDLPFLTQAIQLARAGMERGEGGPFGAVVVREGRVIAEGNNRVLVDHDPTAHAEVVAIRRACAALGHFQLDGCTVYSSCEPCPMCMAAILWARPARLVFAATRDDAAAIGFDDALLYEQLPLPPTARALPTTHRALEVAREVMARWATLPGKIAY